MAKTMPYFHQFKHLSVYVYVFGFNLAEVKYLLKNIFDCYLFSKPTLFKFRQSFQLLDLKRIFSAVFTTSFGLLLPDVNLLHITSNCTVGSYTGQILLYRSENPW